VSYSSGLINISNGSEITSTTSATQTITAIGATGYYQVKLSFNVPTATTYYIVLWVWNSTSSTSDGTKGIYVCFPMHALASTTDQSYQRVTDWTTEQYAWAAQKNVPWLRRNMLLNTTFSGAVAGTPGTAPTSWPYGSSGGTTEIPGSGAITYSATAARHFANQAVTTAAGYTYYFYITVTVNSGSPVLNNLIYYTSAGGAVANYYLDGSVSSASTVITGTHVLGIAITTNSTSTVFRFGVGTASNDTANVTFSSPVLGAALATPYQEVGTSWAATYTALALAAGYPISMYSDAAGSVATYGPDDPVRVMLDQSEGLALGPELVTNGDFSNGTTGWTDASTAPATFTSSDGTGVLARTSSGTARMRVSFQTVAGRCYGVSFNVTGYTLAASGFNMGTTAGGTDVLPDQTINNGTSRYIVRAASSTTWLNFYGPAYTHTHVYDNVSAKEIPGYHATAPSDAARPTLRLDGNGKWYLERDLSDDNLPVTWATNLTSTGVIYTASGDYTTKDSNLILSGATNYTTPKYDYGRVVLKAPSANDAKIIKYLDGKRGRTYQLGPDLVTNGNFSSGTTGWTLVGAAAASGGGILFTGTGSGSSEINQNIGAVSGKTYIISYDIRDLIASPGTFFIALNTNNTVTLRSGTNQIIITAVSNTIAFKTVAYASGNNYLIDNISVREVIIT
jgi:hypothetical protein